MDDFVSKPFTLQTLRGILERWVASRVGPAPSTPPPAVADPVSDSERDSVGDAPFSDAAIEEILELDRLNGGGVFARFAQTFLETVPVTLEKLQAAVRADDAAGIARAAHALTGASLNVGAEPLAAASRELRALVDSGTTEGASALSTKIEDCYLAVKSALESRLEQEERHGVGAG